MKLGEYVLKILLQFRNCYNCVCIQKLCRLYIYKFCQSIKFEAVMATEVSEVFLGDQQLCDLYRSSCLVRVVKFMSLQWIVHVAQSHMED
jgi:hypothetical protein